MEDKKKMIPYSGMIFLYFCQVKYHIIYLSGFRVLEKVESIILKFAHVSSPDSKTNACSHYIYENPHLPGKSFLCGHFLTQIIKIVVVFKIVFTGCLAGFVMLIIYFPLNMSHTKMQEWLRWSVSHLMIYPTSACCFHSSFLFLKKERNEND